MDELETKIAFSMMRGLNSNLASQVIERTGSESTFFDMPAEQLRRMNLPDRLIDDEARRQARRNAAQEYGFVTANLIRTMYFADDNYPERLRQCTDGPTLLYQLGKCDLEARHAIGIVGTRHATPYGLDTARRIVLDLAERIDDLIVISGLAYGIDVAAHRASLEANVPTVAVSAHPLNSVYPAEHRSDAVRIIQNGGAMISEYPTTSIVHRNNFLERNRIVAGLSDALIIVESDLKGGAMTTARLAFEYNREVFAVPGRMTDRYSRGCNDLIAQERAHIFTNVDNLIKIMGWKASKTPGTQMELPLNLSDDEKRIIEALNNRPASTVTEIVGATGLTPGRIKDLLFDLEMNDLVMGMAGGKYSAITT